MLEINQSCRAAGDLESHHHHHHRYHLRHGSSRAALAAICLISLPGLAGAGPKEVELATQALRDIPVRRAGIPSRDRDG